MSQSPADEYRFVITVTVEEEQGAIEASDQIAKACLAIQDYDSVQSVRSQSNAPNDFQRLK